MFSKCLSVLLIGLLYAHQTMAFPGNPYYVESPGQNPYPNERGYGDGYGHGHGHHREHHRPRHQFGLPPPPPIPPFGPGFNHPPSPPRVFPPYIRTPGPCPHCRFDGNEPGYNQQNGGQFGQGQQPYPGQGGGSPFYPIQPRPGNGFQQQPDYNQQNGQDQGSGSRGGSRWKNPYQPPPGQESYDNNQQSGGSPTNPIQPRPGNGFQQPGGAFGQDQESGSRGGSGPNQPRRPGQESYDNNQQSGGSPTNPIQPRPEGGFGQDQGSGSSGGPGQDSYDSKPYPNGFQPPRPQPTLQPRPGQGQDQQPGGAPNSFQPRPVPGSEFNFQTPGEDQGKTFQPRPGNTNTNRLNSPVTPKPVLFDLNSGGANDDNWLNAGESAQAIPSSTASPILPPNYDFRSSQGPAKDTSPGTDAAINSIFNTENFLSPSLNQGPTYRDPKSEAEEIKPEVNQRGLFQTDPICTNGMELKAGRCRKSA